MIANKYSIHGYVKALDYVKDYIMQNPTTSAVDLYHHIADVQLNYEKLFNQLKDKKEPDDSFDILGEKVK